MKKNFFAIGLVVILAFCAGYLGYFFVQKQISLPTINVYGLNELINSELTEHFNILFSGEVTGISGTTLTIRQGDSSLSFDIFENAVFHRKSEGNLVPAQQIKPEDLKTGDLVNVWTSFEKDGRIASLDIMVLQGAAPELP